MSTAAASRERSGLRAGLLDSPGFSFVLAGNCLRGDALIIGQSFRGGQSSGFRDDSGQCPHCAG